MLWLRFRSVVNFLDIIYLYLEHGDFDEIKLDPDDSNYFMQGFKLEDFICQSTASLMPDVVSSSCWLKKRKQGCFLLQTWICPCCNRELILENYDMV
jgi:hypothetical protein